MPDLVTLDVIDRPSGGGLRGMRSLLALRRATVPGLRAVIPLGTTAFVPRTWPAPTPQRIAVLCAWEDGDAVDARWEGTAAGRVARGAGEHWHVLGEVTSATFSVPWRGWMPRTEGARALADDEPALILISGLLRAHRLPVFMKGVAGAVAQLETEPGYLGGLGLASSPLNTTSCSAWRQYRDAVRFAYADGRHATAMKRDVAGEHHRTEHFSRIRPLAERGTLDGSAPFAAVLAGRERAVAA